jgi:hypothetical protein
MTLHRSLLALGAAIRAVAIRASSESIATKFWSFIVAKEVESLRFSDDGSAAVFLSEELQDNSNPTIIKGIKS